ncbi:MAG TPA: glycosyltransferase family 2 protein [Candidatus Faecousia faecigallinarum]|nr:glycosyltransferase family 2 protein [Candidatus Faecousia faecigallinarum]
MPVTLYLAIPCYNEEEVLPETARRLAGKFAMLLAAGTITAGSRICFIDDGSKDSTWAIIDRLHRENPLFSGIKLSRNRGHQNALLCGLMTLRSRADCVISMDADLQDDIDAIDAMLEKFQGGIDVVYGVRAQRETDTAFKRVTAQGFYRVMKALGAEVVFNHADYRLMSRRALDALAEYPEVNLFLRGMVPLVGYPSDVVYYNRAPRFAGESKYPLKKMLAFAWEGITSLSVKPIKLITWLGLTMFLVSMGMLIWFLIRHFTGNTVVGWSSLAVSIWAIGGLQLLAIGIVGQYIGKIYLEAKHRPRYQVEVFLDTPAESGEK